MTENIITLAETIEVLNSLRSKNTAFSFDPNKQTLTYCDTNNHSHELTLPLVLPRMNPQTLAELIQQISHCSKNYTIILIQAGAAAIGFYENASLAHHKVIKKYMVRKKQGKSQIKHLKSKGKSRLGSRIRLKNSIAFFEEINSTLTQWDIAAKSETLLLSLPVNLKHLLFSSNVPVPFDKKDPRLRKIPVDVKVPSYKELLHINWLLSRGTMR